MRTYQLLEKAIKRKEALEKDLKDHKEHRASAREKLREKARYKAQNKAKLQQQNKHEEQGLRRLILPEHNRPFIQKLSVAAGKAALQELKNMS